MSSLLRREAIGRRIEAGALAAEAEFHALVAELARKALSRDESPERVRSRLVAYFLAEPNFRMADFREQERVYVGLQRAIDVGLTPAPEAPASGLLRDAPGG